MPFMCGREFVHLQDPRPLPPLDQALKDELKALVQRHRQDRHGVDVHGTEDVIVWTKVRGEVLDLPGYAFAFSLCLQVRMQLCSGRCEWNWWILTATSTSF